MIQNSKESKALKAKQQSEQRFKAVTTMLIYMIQTDTSASKCYSLIKSANNVRITKNIDSH